MARIALVACAKQKQNEPAAAKDLYTSQLFRGCRAWVENKQNADKWFILSARHGLVKPDEIISPYERTLSEMTKLQVLRWASTVLLQVDELGLLRPGDEVIFMTGKKYREPITRSWLLRGHNIRVPMEGLGIGEQLAWLKRNTTWAP